MAADDDDSFIDGVLIGAVVGTLVGGILGVLLAPRRRTLPATPPETETPSVAEEMPASTNGSIESARRGLEEKLEQLNQAIEATRTRITNNPVGDPPPAEPPS